MLVVFGDQDLFIPVESIDRALAEACRMGDVIDIQKQSGKGHGDLEIAVAVPWLADRFKDAPITNSCESPVAEAPSEGGATSQPDEADATELPG